MVDTGKRRVLAGDQVRVNSQPVRVGGAVAAPRSDDCVSDAASVREIRDAHGNISEIHVQCQCGNVMVLQCDYAT